MELPEGVRVLRKGPVTLPVVLGWREAVSLPEWGVRGLRAKLDSGAATSSIDVDQVEYPSESVVRFDVVTRDHPARDPLWIEAPLVRRALVKPSTGEVQERPVVATVLRIAGIERRIEISLVSRPSMKCRMLVGRAAMAGVILVDSASRHVSRPARAPGYTPEVDDDSTQPNRTGAP